MQPARYATDNYSRYAGVSDMPSHLQWTPLNNRRGSLKVILLYKIVQQLVNISKCNLIPTTLLETKRLDIHSPLPEVMFISYYSSFPPQ